MANIYNLEIVNDIGIDIEYNMSIDGEYKQGLNSKKSKIYNYDVTESKTNVEINVFKEDIWENKHWVNVFFLIIYSIDIVFGNLMESENMPFSINYSERLSINDKDYKILLSHIILVKEDNLLLWKKISTVQIISILLMIFLIMLLLGISLLAHYKVILLLVTILVEGILFILMKMQREKCFMILKKFIKD